MYQFKVHFSWWGLLFGILLGLFYAALYIRLGARCEFSVVVCYIFLYSCEVFWALFWDAVKLLANSLILLYLLRYISGTRSAVYSGPAWTQCPENKASQSVWWEWALSPALCVEDCLLLIFLRGSSLVSGNLLRCVYVLSVLLNTFQVWGSLLSGALANSSCPSLPGHSLRSLSPGACPASAALPSLCCAQSRRLISLASHPSGVTALVAWCPVSWNL